MAASGGRAGSKARRQAGILRIIAAGVVETQEDLALRLHDQGYPVTQATVSRDIRELRLIKIPVGDGRHRYAAEGPAQAGVLSGRMLRLFAECVVGTDFSENLVVITTLPGMAEAVAEAVDSLRLTEVIGTLAGERTVFAVVKPKEAVTALLDRLRALAARGSAVADVTPTRTGG